MAAPGLKSTSSKRQSMAEVHSLESEKSSGGRTRRCSCNVIMDNSDGSLLEYNSQHERGKSVEPQFVQPTEISDDVQTDIDLGSVGTYLVVPGQDQTLKTTPGDKNNPVYVFSHSPKKISLDEIPTSPLLSHDSLLETVVDVDQSASFEVTDYSKFQVLESVLQQGSHSRMREGFITPQNVASVVAVGDSNRRSEAEATPQQYASSDDSLGAAANEHSFRVCEEHVAQQRIVSVEREQCVTKEHAAMSVVRGPNAMPRHHRAVTVNRSQTWSFRDKAKSDQFLSKTDSSKTQGISKLGGSSEQLLDEASACDIGLTVNSQSSPERSKTLPHQLSSHTVRHLPYSVEEPPMSGAVQSCLLRDYNKDKDWSFVPWTDEPRDQ